MLTTTTIARRPRRAGEDMALAATVAFFGIFPLAMAGGLLLVQTVVAIAR